jgi:hypothetical protein
LFAPIPFVPRIVEVSPLYIPFAELDDTVCKYECTDSDSAADYRFCGHPVFKRRYCMHHAAVTCQPPRPRKEVAFIGRARSA